MNPFHVSVGGMGVLAKLERLIETQLSSGDIYAVTVPILDADLDAGDELVDQHSSRPITANHSNAGEDSAAELEMPSNVSQRPATSKSQKSARQKDRFIETVTDEVVNAKLLNSETTNIGAFGMSGLETIPVSIFDHVNIRQLYLEKNFLQMIPVSMCNLTNLGVLRLYSNNIIFVPPELFSLPITSLWLHDNLIVSLPDEIGNAKKLVTFTLHDNPFETMPTALGCCMKLKKLTLPPCCTTPTQALIAQGETQVISYFQALIRGTSTKLLQVASFRLPSVNREIEALTMLTNLQLSSNLLRTLPIGIGQLTNVTEINLSKNRLQELPESMVYMNKMRVIDVSQNDSILALPAAFGAMSQLVTLQTLGCTAMIMPPSHVINESFDRTKRMMYDLFKGCRDETFSAIPGYGLVTSDWLSVLWKSFDASSPERCCNGLLSLSLSYNCITSLHNDLFRISSLVTLLVDHNLIEIVPDLGPESRFFMQRLEWIDFGHNNFSEIPDVIRYATNLVSLGIGGNHLGGIKRYICNEMPKLTRLDISCNRIKKVPDDFRKMKSLTYLNIEDNTFPTLPDEIYVMTMLRSLLLAGNPIEDIPLWASALSSLSQVSLANTKVSSIPKEWFLLKDLMWMSFTGAPIALKINTGNELLWAMGIRAAIGAAASNLGYVRLKGYAMNYMTSLPMGLRFHGCITSLDISNNKLNDISFEIGGLIKLKLLNASMNSIESIDPAIGLCTSLEVLNLCKNPLKALPADLGLITSMQELLIHDVDLTFPSASIVQCGTAHIMRFLLGYSRFNHSGSLNLNGMGFQSIPNDVFLITNLRGLTLDKNPLPSLSNDLIQMSLLELLSLDFSGLRDFNIFNEKWHTARWPFLQTLRVRGLCSTQFSITGAFRITSLTTLALSKNAIHDLPQPMSSLVKLMKLDLSHNLISSIPSWFSSLCNLNEVDLRNNALIKLHPAIGSSMTLRRLYLEHNPDLLDPPKSIARNFGYLGKYARAIFQGWAAGNLILNDLKIDVFQPMMKLLSHIEVLDLSRNIVQYLPEALSDLQSLKQLILNSNRLCSLPNVFDKLTSLEILSVDDNPLISLPFSVGGAASLQHISCNFMPKLICPPFEVASKSSSLVIIYMEKLFNVECGRVIKLDLSGYGMRRWPGETSFLPSLVKLIVNNSRISSIIESVSCLTNLQLLHVKDNQIQELPAFIFRLQRLTDLDISMNGIPDIPVMLQCILKIFKASGNNIASLPASMITWTSLTDLRIAQNAFQVIPEVIYELSNLMHLDIGGNTFSYLPDELFSCLPELLTFHCGNSNLSEIPYSIGMCSKLTDIRLDQNIFREIPYSVGKCESLRVITADWHIVVNPPQEVVSRGISRINEYLAAMYKGTLALDVNVSNYALLSVPNMTGQLVALRRADFSFNAIKQVPPAIGRLRSLVWLSFQNNSITRLPSTFVELSGLTHMNLSSNKFECLPEYFVLFTKLVELDLSGNQLRDIPTEFLGGLIFLQSLKASDNLLQSVPLCLIEFQGVHTLHFHGNPIMYIPGELGKLKNLKHLTFSLNKLECMQNWRRNPVLDYAPIAGHQIEVPPSEVLISGQKCLFEFLRNVASSRRSKKAQLNLSKASFWVSQCLAPRQSFEYFADCLLQLYHLKLLNLHGNDIRIIPQEVSRMTSLMNLDVGGNRLSELPDSLSSLIHLSDLIVLPNVMLESPDRVIILQGSRALVSFYHSMSTANSERKIVMSDLQLPRIPKEALMIQNLLFLDLSRNALVDFPAEIRVMTSLTHLNLEYNFITYIPSYLIYHLDLTWFDISNNWIVAISPLLQLHWNSMPMKWLDLTTNLFPPIPVLKNSDICEKDAILRFHFSCMKSWVSGSLNLDSFDLEIAPPEIFNLGYFSRITMKQLGIFLKEALCDDILLKTGADENTLIDAWKPQRFADLEEDIQRSNILRDRQRRNRVSSIMTDVHEIVYPYRELYHNLLQQLEKYGNPRSSIIPLGPAFENPNLYIFFSKGRLSGLTSLDLQMNKIQNVELGISNLVLLTNLNLGSNNLVMLPPCMKTLSKLTSLTVSSNRIAVIPDEFSALCGLMSFSASHNELFRFDQAMVHWTSLTKLDVAFNNLTVIDEIPCTLTTLTTFMFQDNKITSVSPRIGLLKSLVKVNFGGNPLTSVPPDVANCVHLVDACFNRCDLAKLPISMHSLMYLRKLILTENKLVLIPQFLNSLHHLTELRVDINQIVYATKEFCFCQSLEILHFQDNGLLVLPRALDRMSVLKTLRLDHNCLEAVVPGIGLLRSCESMNLSFNKLSELPAFPASYSLTSLDLSNNKFAAFPESISGLTSLLSLNLSNNLIFNIPSCAALLSRLNLLDISQNLVHTIHPKFWLLSNLEILKMNNNSMGTERPDTIFEDQASLKSDVQNKSLKNVCKSADINDRDAFVALTARMSKLVKLRTLTLSHNSLKHLPQEIGCLTSLTELWIQSNPLDFIPETMSNLTNLAIFTIDSGVPGLASLRQTILLPEPEQSARDVPSPFAAASRPRLGRQPSAAP
jgi:Leucine-rich repeat (LRR) protein